MATETTVKATLPQRAIHEFKELAIVTLYLYITLGAVILFKAAVLHTHGVSFVPWGIAIVKAAVLAKFMLIGRAMKIGEHKTSSPLIWPTLHMAFAFLVLLVIMTIIEEAVVGLFHHQSIAASLGDLFGPRLEETLAISSCCWCSFRIPLSWSSATPLAKAGWQECSLSSVSRWRGAKGRREQGQAGAPRPAATAVP